MSFRNPFLQNSPRKILKPKEVVKTYMNLIIWLSLIPSTAVGCKRSFPCLFLYKSLRDLMMLRDDTGLFKPVCPVTIW